MQHTPSTDSLPATLFGGDKEGDRRPANSLNVPISTPDSDTGGQPESLSQFGHVFELSAASQNLIGRIQRVRADNTEAMRIATKWGKNRSFVEKSWIGDHIGDLGNWNEHLDGMQKKLSEKPPTRDHIHTAETSLANVDKESRLQRARGTARMDELDQRDRDETSAVSERASVPA